MLLRHIVIILLATCTLVCADEKSFGMHRILDKDSPSAVAMKQKDETVYIDPTAQITAKDIKTAFPIAVQGGFEIMLEFTPEGSKRFTAFTTQCVGSRVAVVIDGVIVSSPLIPQPISDGAANITGRFTIDEARKLAEVIKLARGQP